MSYEEFTTLLAQVEACVNSRPLCVLSSSPNDVDALTPGHFLIGEQMFAPPEPNHMEAKASWLTRWQRVQQLSQFFWKRWQAEYLNQLQSRFKWKNKENGPEINDEVLIREENVPATHWQRGIVTQLHPGDDGLTSSDTEGGWCHNEASKYESMPISEG